MKKLDQSISKKFPPVVLYREDLEEIERLLHEHAKDVHIECDGYEFDSIAELAGAMGGKQVRKTELRTREPYFTVELDDNETRVYASSSDAKSAGLFHLIADVLQRRTRSLSWAYKPFTAAVATFVLMNGINTTGLAPTLRGLHLVVGALLFVWVGWAMWITLSRHSVVRVTAKPANIFSHNRDQLLLLSSVG